MIEGNPMFIVISVPERADLLSGLLIELEETGIKADVHKQENRGNREGFRLQSMTALRAARAKGRDLVFLEDDVRISKRFPDALRMAMDSSFDIVTFYAAGMWFYPAAIKRRILDYEKNGFNFSDPFFLFEPINRAKYFGSQCLLIKNPTIDRILTIMENDNRPFDNVLADAGQLGAVFPNPVQHIGVKSAISGHHRYHTSRSFCK